MPPEGDFPPSPGGPWGPGGPEGKGPIPPEWHEMLLGVLLLAANVGLIYWLQARRSATRIRATGADGITLDDGTHVPVGDSYRDKFRKTISPDSTK